MSSKFLVIFAAAGVALCQLERICQLGKDPLTVQLTFRDDENTLRVQVERKVHLAVYYHLEVRVDFSGADERPGCGGRAVPMLLHSSLLRIDQETNYSAVVRNIYSGLYWVTVTPWTKSGSSSSTKILFTVSSSKNAPRMAHWNTTFQLHPFPLERRLDVEFEPANSEFGFESYEVMLFHGIQDCRQAELDGSYFPCVASKDKPSCSFSQLQPGSYCALLRPQDDRCLFGTAWLVDDLCIVHSDMVYLSGPKIIENDILQDLTDDSGVTLSTAILITVLLFTAAILGPLLAFRLRRRYVPKFPRDFRNSSARESLPVRKLHTSKVILLLWIPEDDTFCSQVSKFKNCLQFQHGFQVQDVYDETLYDLIVQDPIQWMHMAVTNDKYKIVIIRSRILEGCIRGTASVGPHPFEHLVIYGLKQVLVHKAMTQSLYTSTFVVSFAELATENTAQNDFTPFRCFLLPEHTDVLLSYLNM